MKAGLNPVAFNGGTVDWSVRLWLMISESINGQADEADASPGPHPLNVRFGSEADLSSGWPDVCLVPEADLTPIIHPDVE